MPRLVFRAAARRDIAQIAAYVLQESGNRETADAFVGKLVKRCERIARLPNLLGRLRSELGHDYRSVVFGNYVIFLRYADEDGPRSHLYVIHIVHRARDIETFFRQSLDLDKGR